MNRPYKPASQHKAFERCLSSQSMLYLTKKGEGVTVGEKVAELLDWSSMTQQDLADKIGVTRANVSAYVNGKASISVEQAHKIAEAFGVSPWTVLNMEPLLATPSDLSQKELELITDLRSLTRHQLELIEQCVALMKKQNSEQH